MKASLTTSLALHAAMLAFGLVSLSAPAAFEVSEVESLPVDIVPLEELTQIQQGDKKAPMNEKPAPMPTKRPDIVADAREVGENMVDTDKPVTPDPKPTPVDNASAPPPAPTPNEKPVPAEPPKPVEQPKPEPVKPPEPKPDPKPEPVKEPEPAPKPAEPKPAEASRSRLRPMPLPKRSRRKTSRRNSPRCPTGHPLRRRGRSRLKHRQRKLRIASHPRSRRRTARQHRSPTKRTSTPMRSPRCSTSASLRVAAPSARRSRLRWAARRQPVAIACHRTRWMPCARSSAAAGAFQPVSMMRAC